MTEVTTIRLPKGVKLRLRILAHKLSIELQRDVSWSAMVREAIEQFLLAKEDAIE
jgi:predicted DNA-binding protein